MKKWIVAIMAIGVLSVFSCSSSQKDEERYQRAVQEIKEGRYGDAKSSLIGLIRVEGIGNIRGNNRSDYKHARILYDYASARTNSQLREFLLKGIPTSYDGPFSNEIKDFKIQTEKEALVAKLKAEEEAKKREAIRPMLNKAIELVKSNYAISGSVESRMIRAKNSFYPDLTWSYHADQVGPSKFKVEQRVDNGKGESFTREWEVNISTKKITPSNLAAINLYR